MIKGEAYFINHCDDENCDLGSFDYVCPSCGKYCVDYDIWWKSDEVYSGKVINFNCLKCKIKLSLNYDIKNGMKVSLIK